MQVIGKLEEVHELVKRTETFQVREFVLEIQSQNSQYPEHVLFQLTNNRTNLIDSYQIGQEIVVDFDLQGRKWTAQDGRVVFFNRLNAWRINPYNPQVAMGNQQPGFAPQQPQMGGYQQPMGGYQQLMGGYQQPGFAPQQPAAQPTAPQQPAAPSTDGGNSDDLPF